jgi:hypothetical protein
MSNTTSLVVYNLNAEANRVSLYIYPLTITLTILTNLTNILILSRRALRTSSCTYYFLALSIGSLVYMIFTPLNIYLSTRFGLSINASPFGCRILYFLVFSTALFYTYMLVCASVDRYFTSSSNAMLRRLSNVRVAKRIILLIIILLIIYLIPFMIISYWNYDTNSCSQYSSTLITIYLLSRVVVYNIIGPLLMAIFGLLTISNVRNQRRRVTQFLPQTRHHRTEGQLTRVLVFQLGIYLLFCLPNAITYVLTTFIPSVVTPTIIGIRTISIIWQQAVHFISLFLYVLNASAFRKELQKMLKLSNQNNRLLRRFNLVQRPAFPSRMNETRL